MADAALYPLAFAPIYQYRLWGGRNLGRWCKTPLPSEGPVGEAWLLSDRDEHPSRVAEGPLKGRTIAELIAKSPDGMLGKLAARFSRFPLLLKFLDVQKMLSVQVHPSDDKADLIPTGESGKTEAWVVLEAEPKSRVYAGLQSGVTAADLRTLSNETAPKCLASFEPGAGQSVLIEAGTVHSLGNGVMVFEVQENSDVTFRLYDWDHIDPKTGQKRPLQVDQALKCVDFEQGALQPRDPAGLQCAPASRERILDCAHFSVWRVQATDAFSVGAENEPRVLVCVEGAGDIAFQGATFAMEKGAVTLLPAQIGVCRFRPAGAVTMLEIAVPGPS